MLHYGLIDLGKMAALGQSKAYGPSVRDALEFVSVFCAAAQLADKVGYRKLCSSGSRGLPSLAVRSSQTGGVA